MYKIYHQIDQFAYFLHEISIFFILFLHLKYDLVDMHTGLHHHSRSGDTHLKGEEGHNNGHPTDCHGDVSSPLLGDDVNGAKEED